jgi:tetratricopeptide (TPR) repeat protein
MRKPASFESSSFPVHWTMLGLTNRRRQRIRSAAPAPLLLLFLAILICICLCSCTLTRDIDSTKQWLLYMEAAHAAKLQARYRDAERLYQSALKESERQGKENRLVAASLDSLGTLYSVQARFDQAEKYFVLAVSTARKTVSKDDPDLAAYLDNLAECFVTKGELQKAESSYKEAIAIWSAMPSHKTDLALSQLKLANVYYYQDRLTDAEPLFQVALPIAVKAPLVDSRLIEHCSQSYAKILSKRER